MDACKPLFTGTIAKCVLIGYNERQKEAGTAPVNLA